MATGRGPGFLVFAPATGLTAQAARIGALEIWIIPSNGRSNSRIRKTALETANAHTSKVLNTVALDGAKRLKLARMSASQQTITTRKGVGIELPFWANISQRICAISVPVFSAWAWSARCASFFGASPWIFS